MESIALTSALYQIEFTRRVRRIIVGDPATEAMITMARRVGRAKLNLPQRRIGSGFTEQQLNFASYLTRNIKLGLIEIFRTQAFERSRINLGNETRM